MEILLKQNCRFAGLLILFYFLSFSSVQAKAKRSDFTDLIHKSQLVVIVDVKEIRSGGKNKSGMAIGDVRNAIFGNPHKPAIEIQWMGSGITALGE